MPEKFVGLDLATYTFTTAPKKETASVLRLDITVNRSFSRLNKEQLRYLYWKQTGFQYQGDDYSVLLRICRKQAIQYLENTVHKSVAG